MTEPIAIKYADIRKGDRIRRTEVEHAGTSTVTTGVVYNNTVYGFDSEEGTCLAWKSDDEDEEITLELLERPKAKLPTEPGSVILAKKVRGTKGNFTLFLRAQNESNKANWSSVERIEDKDWGGTYYWHPEERIEDWELAKVVKTEA